MKDVAQLATYQVAGAVSHEYQIQSVHYHQFPVGNWGAAPINLGLVVSVGGALRRDPLHVRPRRHVPTLVRRGERQRLAGQLALGDERVDTVVPGAQHVFPKCLRVLLLDRLGCDPAATHVLWRLCTEVAFNGEGYERADPSRNRDMVVGLVATVYGLWLVYAAGINFLLMTAVLLRRESSCSRSHAERRSRKSSRVGSITERCKMRQFGVHSEMAKLRTVMVCRPSLARSRLTPGDSKDLQVPRLGQARPRG
jgi:hypothetical protein